ncbi:glycerophosphocholine phosphodiesterase,putative [Wickerhamomyces ciferrii]|uniref:Glycerophosphocholine phosphodiesterase,putative n=1 Tax=Wickerhamomyces ciferrii (strain ATCC 14091 / BCRC 22168 / CBS 111 / JCM 3599 / NBRC 0793 / NRRL Y-1031 F-60-10) TaxID=1206466 RepID=K0KTU4_WICCF|nr:glycerophosphocholine phosphodiesterase,putative [Wickerhamomyces ciferrii]CCH44668.1 glycerophosphocholine phosphodiesterase,putative [Wickerhamomyces ciferrii]
MNYKDLKKQIKLIKSLQKSILKDVEEQDPDVVDLQLSDALNNSQVKGELAGFFFSLDRNIEKVDDFYNKQYSEYDRRLKKISSIINSFNGHIETLDHEELEEIIGVLIELRSCFRNLKWFGELNKRGFVKILKKLDKKTGTSQQGPYLNSRIFPLSFAHESDIIKDLSSINVFLNKLSPHVETSKLDESNGTSKRRSSGGSISPDKYQRFIEKDDEQPLINQLIVEYRSIVLVPVKILVSLLNKASLSQSTKCISKLLEVIPSLGDPSDISGRNFFHHHIIALGKQIQKSNNDNISSSKSSDNVSALLSMNYLNLTPAALPDANYRMVGAFGPDGVNSNDSPTSLLYILNNLPPHLRPALLQRDNYRRTPLHYAAQFGLREITTIIIDFLKSWNEWDATISVDSLQIWGDAESLSPLHLAVLGTHPKTVEVLVANSNKTLTSPRLILLASRLNSPSILNTLLQCQGIDINYRDPDTKETPLYIATKLNFGKTVEFLLEKGANTEIGEASFGWTPIFIAAVEGLYEIVVLLKKYGAIYSKEDESGWTPMEHACLRGHLQIADILRPINYNHLQQLDQSNGSDGSIDKLQQISSSNSSIDKIHKSTTTAQKEEIYKSIRPKTPKQDDQTVPQPVKSFGHKYLTDQSVILITLGSNDTREGTEAIKLDRVPISKVHSTELDTALSLVVRAKSQPNEPPHVLDLPIDDAEPLTIYTSKENPEDEIIYFDIVPTYGGQHKQILGRAVAILDKIYTKVGDNRRSLNKVATVPIIETETLDVLGTLKFEVLIVTPFHHPNMNSNRTEAYWKSLVSTRVIGHRGLGKNVDAKNSLQLGENTIESFIAAASLGASYVEFDVQLTKDNVPVIYHDFLVAESGADIPMHELTLEQFLNLNNVYEQKNEPKRAKDDEILFRPRSASHFHYNDNDSNNKKFKNDEFYSDKMKLTKTYKDLGFKGNLRGSSIASSFVTLKELFKKIPQNVGFNIECKYPLLYEAQEDEIGEVMIDLNFWIDTVLQIVYDNAKGRDIIFSSFHPEACLLLSLKQPSIPILFLTESGTNLMPDVRCGSLQSAVRFAKKWNLLGIVSAAEPIVKCPRLAQVVKASGLCCFTYGVLNNDPENARLQMDAGVDAVIVDNVMAVKKELQKTNSTSPSNNDLVSKIEDEVKEKLNLKDEIAVKE